MSSKIADFRPKTVWLGTTVPGKKMMAMIGSQTRLQRGKALIDLYKNEPYDAIIAVSLALYAIPSEGAQFGPSLWDLMNEQHPGMQYGAILTDIRDFLKLRFSAKGLAENEELARIKLEEVTGAGGVREALEKGDPALVVGYVVNYVITALDALSRSRMETVESSLVRLRYLLTSTARWLAPEGQDYFDKYVAALFQQYSKGNK